ncbi:TPA: hypothetical protein N0F65_011663 [Lagenidium giganteum]|uniref:L-type lectin-like domain-containing protein n=1 Tax=Lagenidium giganteum TaxID=4803 RepID=A0AAV2ZCZ6_9STRA|nr:TPA: hypothetical protein N0F65_011663 [Lagenidium giganteum]
MMSIAMKMLALVVALCLSVVSAELVGTMSFEKPFDMISPEGERQIGANWDFGGTTTVNRHFVRLTPDRQNKRGWIWSKEKFGRREFSLVITFRISGQAESWFGDGIGLWITRSPRYVEGGNHGFIGNFEGLGLVFDTFVNSEHSGGHKDITFFQNDGSKSLDNLNDMKKVGCMAPGIRYHEKNAAFSPSLNMSRVKLQYKEKYVVVSVDAKNTGEWVTCYRSHVDIVPEWIEESTIGITSSTGALADNHDVIAISVYDDVIDMSHAANDEKVKNKTMHDLDESLNSGTNEDKMRLLKRKYEQLIEDFEHQFTALKESTENTILKLRKQEAEDTKRIVELEAFINGQVAERVENTATAIRDQVEERLEQTVKETAKKTSGWKTPFFILLLVLGAIVGLCYKKYQDLRKSHLL